MSRLATSPEARYAIGVQSPYAPYAPPQQPAAFAPVFRYEPLGWKTGATRIGLLVLPFLQIALSVASLAFADTLMQNLAVAAAILLASLVVSIVALATMVLFLVWTHQAAKNVRALGQQGLSYSPGWCVGWWFVPVASLWKPYQALKEIWRASDPASVSAEPEAWKTGRVPTLFPAWWIAYLVNNFIATAGLMRGFIEGLEAALQQGHATSSHVGGSGPMLGHFFAVIAAVCIASIMNKLAQRQEASWQKLQSRAEQASDGWSGYGPPGGSAPAGERSSAS
jgi:uncharacterized protein DUF4328